MEKNKKGSMLMWALVAALLSQNLLMPVLCTRTAVDQSNCNSPPDPHAGSHGSPPSHSGGYGTPPTHGGGGYGTPPTHGGGGYGTPPSYGGGSHGTPPSYGGGSHGTPPSHGGGSHGGSPPCHCDGTPPSGGHQPTPSTPTPTIDPPSHSGGYTYSPPISGGGTPSTPITYTPPATPIVIPGISVPSPPYVIDPNSPPFPCNYWLTHPTLIWGVFGWLGTVGGAFSHSSISSLPSIPGLGSSTTLQQALGNVRTDGYGSLYREGTAALLNSMVDHKFPFTTSQVRDSFIAATKSDKAAGAQGHVFKLANEGRLKT